MSTPVRQSALPLEELKQGESQTPKAVLE